MAGTPPSPKKSKRGGGLQGLADQLLEPMVQYAELHGLLYAAKPSQGVEDDPSLATQCPVAMLPFKIPANAFDDVVALSPLWNKLVDVVARDLDWLYATLDCSAKADSFTSRLLTVSKSVHAEGGLRQKTMLGVHRSDYMFHEPETGGERCRFLQVELNTIASSMSSHSFNTCGLHRYMLGRFGSGTDATALALREHYGVTGDLLEHLPANRSMETIPAAFAKTHQAYGSPDAVVLFVVQPNERNFADQRCIEYALWQAHGIKVLRRTLLEVKETAVLDGSSGRLSLPCGQEVSVVYYRAGYSPDDYPSEAEWEGRTILERSLAIKCPSVDYQLVGAKKVQQALAAPGVLERFLPGSSATEDCARLRTCFAGLWGLGPGENDERTIEMALKEPEKYVLKPQREGGGHNYYGADVAMKLKELSIEERGAFILMERILPKTQASVMTRAGRSTVSPALSEFGFYSTYLGDGTQVLLSEHAGHLVRTKSEGVDEGGVAAGYAVISSPFLIN